MSKIGRLPIKVKNGVTVQVDARIVNVKGPHGELKIALPPKIELVEQEGEYLLSRKSEDKQTRAKHGLTRALLANAITGVSDRYTKVLELVGTGYRAKLAGNKLVLSLGFSHEVEFVPKEGIEVSVEGTNLVTIKGYDKQLVGETAAVLRSLKKPEPYKGKGIKYQNEVIRRKAGKAAKTGAA